MKRKIQEKVLEKVEKDIPLKGRDRQYIEELTDKGLIKESDRNSYELTSYGQLISVMGYRTHEKTEKFEEKLSDYTRKKTRRRTYILLSFLLILIIVLLWEFRNLLLLFNAPQGF